jgi:dipeptidyl aminopeptidase/acylaminoacyl peptidase
VRAGGTAEDYARAEQFLRWNYPRLAFKLSVEPHWLGKTDRFWYRLETRTGAEFVLVDPKRGTRESAFDQAKLAAALSRATGKDLPATHLPFQEIEYTNDGHTLEFQVHDDRWSCDLKSYQCAKRSRTHAEDQLLSPDGRWVAFLKDHNLFVRSTVNGEEIQLTTDGVADFDYGSHAGSDLSYVTDQVEAKKLPPLALWSPDSKRILTQRLDQRQVGYSYLLQSVLASGGVRPVLWPFHYPFPGDPGVPTVQLNIFDIASRARITVDGDPLLVLFKTPLELDAMWWTHDGNNVYFIDAKRGLKSWRLRVADARTGDAHTLVEERGPTYVEVNADAICTICVIGDGAEAVIWSERDGWGHLYLYDARTGTLKNQVTHGAWQVRDVVWIDNKTRSVYFTAGGREPGRDPYFHQLYRASLDGSSIKLLSPEDADHQVIASPSGAYFVDTYSRVDLPPTTVLRSADGKVIRTLEKADVELLIGVGWKPPERFSVKAADGATDLYGAIYRPSRFDSSKTYPVIDAIYPGPQTIRTAKTFLKHPHPAAGESESLAELGFIVVTVDGRGTPYRSKAFHDISYGKMGQAGNLEDHIAALRALHGRYPYMDLDRVGIIGHSAGGYAAARAILSYPDFYRVAVSSAGLHDLLGYNADWGEIYQGLPDGKNYENEANKDLAASLKGRLLLIYGDMDDNVPPALTLQLMDALIKANKDFDLLVLPNRNHISAYTDPYATRHRWDYLVKNLLGVEPPSGYAIKPPQAGSGSD